MGGGPKMRNLCVEPRRAKSRNLEPGPGKNTEPVCGDGTLCVETGGRGKDARFRLRPKRGTRNLRWSPKRGTWNFAEYPIWLANYL